MKRRDLYIVINKKADIDTIELLIEKFRDLSISFTDYKFEKYEDYTVVYFHLDSQKQESELKEDLKKLPNYINYRLVEVSIN